jgi:hypothetical protein
MFLDHPALTATNSMTGPDRIERRARVYGYAMALADARAWASKVGDGSSNVEHEFRA